PHLLEGPRPEARGRAPGSVRRALGGRLRGLRRVRRRARELRARALGRRLRARPGVAPLRPRADARARAAPAARRALRPRRGRRLHRGARSPPRSARVSFFALLARVAALALIALSWPLAWPRWPFAALGALAPLRVPTRRLVLETLVLFLVLALVARSATPLWGALGCLIAAGLAPRRLRMNGVDRYFVAQERRGTPMNSHHFVETKEPLDRPLLARAVAAFQRDVPIAQSYVHEAFLGVERFLSWSPLFGRTLRWLDRPLRPEDLDAPFDLLRGPPFRVLHAMREGGGFVLVLTVHHSAADGTAGFLLLARLLQRYDELRTGRREERFAKDPPARRFRELLRPRGWRWIFSMIRRHVRPLDKLGVENASLLDDEKPQPYSSRHVLLAVPGARFEELKAEGAAQGLTRNDLLLAAALRAADAWRQARSRPDRPFRVLFPIDLRPLLGLEP